MYEKSFKEATYSAINPSVHISGWISTPNATRKGDVTITAPGYTPESGIEGVTKYDESLYQSKQKNFYAFAISPKYTEWSRERNTEHISDQTILSRDSTPERDEIEWSRQRSAEQITDRNRNVIQIMERSRSVDHARFRRSHINGHERRDDWNEVPPSPGASRYTSHTRSNITTRK